MISPGTQTHVKLEILVRSAGIMQFAVTEQTISSMPSKFETLEFIVQIDDAKLLAIVVECPLSARLETHLKCKCTLFVIYLQCSTDKTERNANIFKLSDKQNTNFTY